MRVSVALFATLALAAAEIFFKEEFSDNSWEKRWVYSKNKDIQGKFKRSHGKFYGDAKINMGIQTSQDAKFYALATKFPKFSNKGKNIVIQFTVKHEQGIDCGGGYIKVMPSTVDLEDFHGETPYSIMFGPDICSFSKVHVIFNYKGANFAVKKSIPCKRDELTHLYTLLLNHDNSYEVQIDGEKVEGGLIEEDFTMLKAKKITDPDAKKPDDWDEREYIDDPTDKKPEDWDKPEHIPDPDANKPEDWDDEMDGEWEPPMIDNPEYKGEWKPKQIKNPDYKGIWIHPEVDNPEYVPDENLYLHEDLGAVGFDLWQVKSGSIFDNIIITDSYDEAKKFADETFGKTKEGEKKMKEDHEKKEAEKRKKEEEEKKKKESEVKEEDEEEEDEEEEHEEKKEEKTVKEEKEEKKEEKKKERKETKPEKEEL